MGFAGKNMIPKLRCIIGLDPASPNFPFEEPNARLSKEDAHQVTVIHTSTFMLGYKEPIGDVDIYINFGRGQKGCCIDFLGMCSHSMAPDIYADALLQPEKYRAFQCEFENIEAKSCNLDGDFILLNQNPIKQKGCFVVVTEDEKANEKD